MKQNTYLRATDFAHNLLNNRIAKGSTVIDGTMGNGYDTLFLYHQVGEEGNVFSFDIQESAIDSTKKRLKNSGIDIDFSNIHLIFDGHEKIPLYVKGPISAAMFNLGYLPGGNKEIITKADTTIQALSNTLSLLERGGIVSIVIYSGHTGGLEEKQSLMNYVSTLSFNEYTVMQCNYVNKEKDPPTILLIERINYS